MATRKQRRNPTKDYPRWTEETRSKDPNAEIVAWRRANGVTAIHVVGASYRSSRSLTGAFEMLSEPKENKNGVWRVEVCCGWHGVKPPTSFPQLTLKPEAWRIEDGFNRDVADNIARP